MSTSVDLSQLIREAGNMINKYEDKLRAGQTLWNALVYVVGPNSDIAEAIWNTDADPYYKDENIPAFFALLMETPKTG